MLCLNDFNFGRTRTSGGLSNFKNFESYKHRDELKDRPHSEIIEEIKRSPIATKQQPVTTAQPRMTSDQLPAASDLSAIATVCPASEPYQ